MADPNYPIDIELEAALRDMNPWWEGKPGPVLPAFRRWAYGPVLRKLQRGLAPATVVRGPRQVGKTTLLQQLVEHLLTEDKIEPRRILHVQFDELTSLRGLKDPVLAIARWFQRQILGESLNEAARTQRPVYVLLDEVQNLTNWAPQLKSLVDHNTVRVLVTGSSALRIEEGRDSLAGRITTVDLGTLLLREIAGLNLGSVVEPLLPENGLGQALLDKDFWVAVQAHGVANADARDRAFIAFSARGGYPMAHERADVAWPEVADQLNETVIRRALIHDLRMGDRGRRRDAQLLEEVFRLAAIYAGQSPGQGLLTQEIGKALNSNVGWRRILAYLKFLEGAMLLRLVDPLELRLRRRKGNRKIALCDHGLRASWLQEVIPLDSDSLNHAPHLRDLAGHLVESIVGYFLSGLLHLDLAYFPRRNDEPEVDYVLTIGERRIPLEIKYQQRIDPHRDTLGLRAFIEKTVYNAPFGILVTQRDDVQVPDPRIVCVSLPSLLLMR